MIHLAHSASGGGSFDEVALAAGLVLLGLAFLVQKSMDRRVGIVLVVLGLVALIGSQTFLKNIGGGNTIAVQGQEFTEDELVGAMAAMCTARNGVEDPGSAQVTFLDRAHLPLHVIGAAVADEDRALSASLLEAKQAVEEEFAGEADPDELEDGLNDLIEVTAEALTVLGMAADTC